MRSLLLCVFILSAPLVVLAGDREVLFRDDFNNLDNWKPFYFKKRAQHSSYTVETTRQETYLRAQSRASAPAIVSTRPFDVYEYPRVTWRWIV